MDPYQTPKSELENQDDIVQETELAKRSTRLWANLIDSLIGMIAAVPFWLYTGFFDMILNQKEITTEFTIISIIYGMLTTILIHGYFLHKNGQSLGKKWLNIKITSTDGSNPGLMKILTLRILPLSICPLIPVIGTWLPTISILFIFRKDRRCIHDFIAGTKVVID